MAITAPTSITLDEHLAKAGPAAASFARLWGRLWQQPYLSAELLELCRLTFARLHADGTEQSAINPHLAPAQPSPERRRKVLEGSALDDPAFSAGEQAVLLFAEYYWTDAQSITDDAARDVVTHFGEPGLVFLIEALGCLDGRIRTARCLRDIAAHATQREAAYVH